MTALLVHFSFAFREGLRNRQLLFMNYLFTLSFYGLVGLVLSEITPDFIPTLIPTMAIFATMAILLIGLPDPLVNAREAGIFRSYRINGVPALHILIVPALTSILHLALVTGIILATAPILFEAPLPDKWGGFLAVFLATALALSGLGVLIGVVASSSRVTAIFSQLVFLPSMLIGGLMMPYSMLPASVRPFARLMPANHAINAFRGLAFNLQTDFPPVGSLIVLVSSGLLAYALAIYLFNWDRHNETRRGHPAIALLAILPYVAGLLLGS